MDELTVWTELARMARLTKCPRGEACRDGLNGGDGRGCQDDLDARADGRPRWTS